VAAPPHLQRHPDQRMHIAQRAKGAVGLDVLSRFESVTFDFKELSDDPGRSLRL
jgi:hypothetical protein